MRLPILTGLALLLSLAACGDGQAPGGDVTAVVATVRGTVTTAAGAPAPEVWVHLRAAVDLGHGPLPYADDSARADVAGQFTRRLSAPLAQPATGTVVVSVTPLGGGAEASVAAPVQFEPEASAHATTTVTLHLP